MARPVRGVPTNLGESGDALRAVTRFGSGAENIGQGLGQIASGVGQIADAVSDARMRADTAADALLATRALGETRTLLTQRVSQLDPLAADYADQVQRVTDETTGTALFGTTFARRDSRQSFEARMADLAANTQIGAAETRVRAVRQEAEAAVRESMDTARAEIELNPRNAALVLGRVREEIQGLRGVFPQASLDRMARGFAREVLQAEVTGLIRQGDIGSARRLVDRALTEGGVNQATARALRAGVQAAANQREVRSTADEAEMERQLLDAAVRSQDDPEALVGLLQNVEALIEDGRFSRTTGTIAAGQRLRSTIEGYLRRDAAQERQAGRAEARETRSAEQEAFAGLLRRSLTEGDTPEGQRGVLSALEADIEGGTFTTTAGLRDARELRDRLRRDLDQGAPGAEMARTVRGMLAGAERESQQRVAAVRTVFEGGNITPTVAGRALPALADANLRQMLQEQGREAASITPEERRDAELQAGVYITSRGAAEVPRQTMLQLAQMEQSQDPNTRAMAAQVWHSIHEVNPTAATRLRRQLPGTDAILTATAVEGARPTPQALLNVAQMTLTLGADVVATRSRAALEDLGTRDGQINPRAEVQRVIGRPEPVLEEAYRRAYQTAFMLTPDRGFAQQRAQEAVRQSAPLSRVGTSEHRPIGVSFEQATSPEVRAYVGGDEAFAELMTERLRRLFEENGLRDVRFFLTPMRGGQPDAEGRVPFVVRYETPAGLPGFLTARDNRPFYAPRTVAEADEMLGGALTRRRQEAVERPGVNPAIRDSDRRRREMDEQLRRNITDPLPRGPRLPRPTQ